MPLPRRTLPRHPLTIALTLSLGACSSLAPPEPVGPPSGRAELAWLAAAGGFAFAPCALDAAVESW